MKTLHLLVSRASCLAISASLTFGCATMKSAKDSVFAKEENTSEVKNENALPAAPVIQQPSDLNVDNSPSNARVGRDYWVDLRDNNAPAEGTSENDKIRMTALLATGDWQSATDLARVYLKKSPKDQHALSILASGLALGKKYNLAAYYARMIDRVYGANSETANIRGVAIMLTAKARIDDYHAARDLFKQSFESSEKQIASGLNLGHLQLELGDAENASLIFRQAAERCDQCLPARMGLGIALSRTGKHTEASKVFEGIVKQFPDNSEGNFRLGLAAKNGAQDNDKAKEHFEKVFTKPTEEDTQIKRRALAVYQRISEEQKGMLAAQDDMKDPVRGELKDKHGQRSNHKSGVITTSAQP